jgi:hypothetical protein
MTSYLNDTTIWKSYFMIKYMWNFILMKCIVARWFDLHTCSGYHYFVFFLRNPSEYLYLRSFEFIWCVQKIMEMKKEL